ncbi:unnamed protein product, partial [Heterosigma akashiwo]
LLLAELLTNAHAFVTSVTNHTGPDVYAFEGAVRPKSGALRAAGDGQRQLRGGNDAGLRPRLAQLPDRAPRVAGPEHAGVPAGGPAPARAVRPARRALR